MVEHLEHTQDKRETRHTPQEPPRSGGKLRWVGLAALIVVLAVAAGGILERRHQEFDVGQWTAEQAIPTVSVITPQSGVSGTQTVLPGDIQAWYEAPIYARVNGYVKNWYFDYGAHVKKGQILADIEAPDLDAELAAAKATLDSAKALVDVQQAQKLFADSTYARWRDSPTGVVSLQERESKQADAGSAVANLDAALENVKAKQGDVDRLMALEGFKQLIVPFDGVVTARETDIGALINAGSGVGGGSGPELFRVADIHEMRVYVQVPQQMSAGIHPGLTAELNLPQYPDKTFKAVVATTSNAISMTARTLLVELHADNPDGLLQPGAYAEVHFELPSDPNMVHVPTSVLLFREHGLKVAVVGTDNKVTLKPVTLGRNLGTQIEVLKGLTPADHVVNSPPDSLAAGDLVHVEAADAQGSEQADSEPGSEKD